MGYTVSDLGSNEQLSQVSYGGVTWNFRNQPLVRLELGSEGTVLSSSFDTVATTETTITYTRPETDSLTVVVTLDDDTDNAQTKLTVSVSNIAPGDYLKWYDILFGPSDKGNLEDNYYTIPDVGGSVVRNPTTLGDYTSAPGVVSAPGSVLALDGGPSSALDFAPTAWTAYYWDDGVSAPEALMIATDDQDGRGKAIITEPAEDHLVYGIRVYRPNGLDTTDNSDATMNYNLLIKPISGNWWDCAVDYIKQLRAAGFPGLAAGRIRENPTKSLFIKEAVLFANMSVQPAGAGDTPRDVDWTVISPDWVTWVRSYLGLTDDNRVIMNIYRWHQNNFDELWPAFRDTGTGAVPNDAPPLVYSIVDTVANGGAGGTVRPILYQIPANWHPEDPNGLDGSPTIVDYTLRNPSGNRYVTGPNGISEITGTPDVADDEHERVNWQSATARSLTRTLWMDRIDNDFDNNPGGSSDPLHQGIYLDITGGMGPYDDYNTTSIPTATDRGIGATIFMPGKRAFMRELRSNYRNILSPDRLFVGEFTELDTVLEFDATSTRHWDIANLSRRPQGVLSTMVSPYHRLFTFEYISSRENAPTGKHNEAFKAAHMWSYGFILSFWQTAYNSTDADDTSVYTSVVPTDGGVDDALWDFIKKLYFSSKDIVLAAHRGQRLKDLPGSVEKLVAEQGTQARYTELPSGTVAYPDLPGTVSSAWLTDEFPGEVPGSQLDIVILLGNWRFTDTPEDSYSNTDSFRVQMNTTDYPWLIGRTTMVEIDPATGQETGGEMMSFDGHDETFRMSPHQVRILRIKNVTSVPSKQIL